MVWGFPKGLSSLYLGSEGEKRKGEMFVSEGYVRCSAMTSTVVLETEKQTDGQTDSRPATKPARA